MNKDQLARLQRHRKVKQRLATYATAVADVPAFATIAAAYLTQLELLDNAKIKGATARATLSALNAFLRDDLRAGMELLKDTHEEAYKALREASQGDDARFGKGKAKEEKVKSLLSESMGSLTPAAAATASARAFAPALTAAAPPKQVALQGPSGADVQVSVVVEPEDSTTITRRETGKPNAQSVYSSDSYTAVGQVPNQVTYHFRFTSRPWQLALDARIEGQSQVFRLNNAALGWEDAALTKADEVLVVLTSTAV